MWFDEHRHGPRDGPETDGRSYRLPTRPQTPEGQPSAELGAPRRLQKIMGIAIPEVLNPYPPKTQVNYLLGVRGVLAGQTFIYLFLQLFAPTTVKDSANPDGPIAQELLRKTIGVLFWNGSLTYSAIIILSARTIVLPFFSEPSKTVVASSLFRRPIRLALPVFIAIIISTTLVKTMGTEYITTFATKTGNKSISAPTSMTGFVVFFNSIFTLFWQTRDFSKQNGSTGVLGQSLWIVSIIFQQSYTLYMTMIIIPYTRPQWRLKALMFFVLTAWWVQSWAWYSITGLIIADTTHTLNLRHKIAQGIPVQISKSKQIRFPWWIGCILCMIVGFMMQYFWVAWRPDLADGELKAHGGIYNPGRLNDGSDFTEPAPRMDNYLVIFGFFFLLECSQWLRWIFASKFLVMLGKRSYSKSKALSNIFDKSRLIVH